MTRDDRTIALDMRASFGSNGRRGIGRYTAGLAEGLRSIGAPTVFLAPSKSIDSDRARELGFDLLPCDPQTLCGLAASGPTIFHSCSIFEYPAATPVIPAAATSLGLPVTATLYDAIPYLEPDRYQADPGMQRFYQSRAVQLRTCDHLMAISEYSARSAVELLGLDHRRVSAVGTGIDDQFRLSPHRARSERLACEAVAGLRRPFVLAVAGNDDRKNGAGLIRGYSQLSRSVRDLYQLVIVGALDESRRQQWTETASRSGCRSDEVILAGEVNDDALCALYQTAALTVFPSLSEGFGLPVAEAAACGCPTITSDTTATPEVLDWRGSTFDPTDDAALSTALHRGLTDERFRDELVSVARAAAARWRWPAVAERFVNALANLDIPDSSTRTRRIGARRRQIALVGPFGGSPSGIGAYNERLIEPLDELADVTCFVEAFWAEAPLGADGRRFPARALGRHLDPDAFDDIVYTLGNSPFHLTSATMLVPSIQGHIWLHEAQMAELHVGSVHRLKYQEWGDAHLRTEIRIDAGLATLEALTTADGRDGLFDVDRFHDLDIRLLRRVIDSATTVITSSVIASDIVRRSASRHNLPILTLPIAFPDAPVPGTGSLPTDATEGCDIAVLGWLSSRKGVERAMRILALLALTVDARIVFIGKALEGTVESLQAAAIRHGVSQRIEITGYVTPSVLQQRLSACRVGLRLADRTDGEMSAAVTEMVSFGIPTITDLATMAPSSPGLVVVPNASDAEVSELLWRLLVDDHAWHRAHLDAHARAQAWSFGDVAQHLVEWLNAHGRRRR